MGGNLFKDKCAPVMVHEAERIVDEVITKIHSKWPNKTILPVGSAGFKAVLSDIDIAIEAKSLKELKGIITSVFGDDVYMMEALYIISIPYQYRPNEWVSIDFIQMVDVDYTYFRYKSPNYLKGESKYKVGTKIMLVGDLLRLSPDRLTNLEPNQEGWMDYSPIGLYRYVYLKNNVSSYYYKQFITTDVDAITGMIFKDPKREDFDTVESIWKALHTKELKGPEMLKMIEASFFVNCYRKSWEALVHPEDFELSCWTVDEINSMLAQETEIRKANQLLDLNS